MANDSIKISKKYGVNPTIPVCFFWGEEKGEIAFMGKIGGRGEDIEAPKHMILDYEPCDTCKENMAKGITLIGVVTEPMADNRPPLTVQGETEFYPTGTWCVVSEDFIRRTINNAELAESIIKARKTIAEHDVVCGIIKQQ